ncbi:hypothetical protein NECAME_11290 [Necator americanus]|uniref:Uncharacterized protein n=1 Tax=Necator americanus TaxID=51031 RepID=W2T597_NECAM|nr:hypothetical protein NECAME_11290 [Necator americanus]ETN77088.1 hypothetical protein NECAME_11290 [Necator americanus]
MVAKMSIMDSDGLSASEMIVGFGDTMDDRDVLGHWMKPPKQLGSNSMAAGKNPTHREVMLHA